jgi:hypothetical protein
MSAMMLELATINDEKNLRSEPTVFKETQQRELPGGHQMKTSLYIAHNLLQPDLAPIQAGSTAFQQQDRPLSAKISTPSYLSAA